MTRYWAAIRNTQWEKHKPSTQVPNCMAVVRNIAQGVTSFTSNAFLIDGEQTTLVDVGNEFDAVDRVQSAVGDLDRVVLTHTHPDHVGTLQSVTAAFEVEIWGFDADNTMVDHALDDGATTTIGDEQYRAIHTPGHKNDHLCLYSHTAGVLFAGDLIFANGGFGRTDLQEGNRTTLIESIETVLGTIDDDLDAMYVGHGPSIETNPIEHIEVALNAARRSQ